MKIAVIGAGISGLTAAWYLSGPQPDQRKHQVVLFESNTYAGGHTDTHQFQVEDQTITVDSGFIVFNEHNYPNFTRLLRSLNVPWRNSDMSFSAVDERSGLFYGAEGLKRLFAQKRNLLRPSFYRMLLDIKRFYEEGQQLLQEGVPEITLGQYLSDRKYSQEFIHFHIIPMACALWSAPASLIADFPLQYMLSFMNHHRMLQFSQRPQWLTVKGGSRQYVEALLKRFTGELRLDQPALEVRRQKNGALISTNLGSERFDAVIFACHSDQALALLGDPSADEQRILGAIPYQKNHVVIHTDERVMPPHRNAWASWNARIPQQSSQRCTVTYWMNLLQGFESPAPVFVTLNPDHCNTGHIPEEHVLAHRQYQHPVYTRDTLKAQQQRGQINGQRDTYFCGAYWGWGFHEDGVRSALDVVQQIQHSHPESIRNQHHAEQCAV